MMVASSHHHLSRFFTESPDPTLPQKKGAPLLPPPSILGYSLLCPSSPYTGLLLYYFFPTLWFVIFSFLTYWSRSQLRIVFNITFLLVWFCVISFGYLHSLTYTLLYFFYRLSSFFFSISSYIHFRSCSHSSDYVYFTLFCILYSFGHAIVS